MFWIDTLVQKLSGGQGPWYYTRVRKGNGIPRFSLQVTFEVASRSVTTSRVNDIIIVRITSLTKFGRKKNQIFMSIFYSS